ncbi:MAG: TonB-dependent receptor [Sphingobium sp.]|nr:TonB-dependent receptor [Sphingobium sp.]
MKTTNSTIGQTLRFALLASTVSLGAMAWTAPAFAQDGEKAADSGETQAIVITGSRIARSRDYDSNSPMVTVNQDFLQQSSTAAVEQQLNKLPQFVVSQSSTTKNNEGTLTFAGGDIQPNATNTPGAATVSLRGVGANRTLVLIDGRRGAPGNASGSVDVSTIPSAALERVEVISGGASATYGADAVAGVTNFILRKNFKGIELDGQMGFNGHGGGFEYQVSGIMGADIDGGRGNISIAMSLNSREFSLQKDNPFFKDLWANPNTTSGGFFFAPRPGISGLTFPANSTTFASQFPGAQNASCTAQCSVYVNSDGSVFTAGSAFGSNFATRGAGAAFLKPWASRDDQVGAVWKTTSVGTLLAINGLTPETVPTDRYNFLARGNYEINDWIGVFAQGMFSNSTTYTVQEPSPITFGWDVFMPWGSDPYTGTMAGILNSYTNPAVPSSIIRNGDTFGFAPYVDPTPGVLTDNPTNPTFKTRYGSILACANSAVGGCSNTQVFQDKVPTAIQTLLNGRTNPNAPVSLAGYLPLPRATYSDVTTYSLTAGLEGSIPGTDWTWEAFASHSVARTLSRQTGMYSLERLRAVVTAPNFGQNFSFTGNQFGGLGGLSAGFGASTGTCTSGLNFFGGYQGVSADCKEAITADVSNRGTTRQTIAEFNLQGGLFDLPAGQLRFALGASYRENRYEFVNETLSTAGRSFLDQTVGIYPSSNMENAGIDAKELYGELLIPVIHDTPLIQELNLEVGGRMSHYNTTGTSYTFKVLADWKVTDWLRFRGGFNRAERAPNIAELLLTPQQAFRTDPTGDVCSTRHENPGSANQTLNTTGALSVQAICLELMARDNGGIYVPITDANSYYAVGQEIARQPTGGGAGFGYSVGNTYYREHLNPNAPALKPEVADTITFGAVIRSPFDSPMLSRLNFTADYFKITINDPIGDVGAGGVLLRCVSPEFNSAAAGVAQGASSAADLNTAAIRARAQAAIAQSTCPQVFRAASSGFGANGGLNTARIYSTYDNDGIIKISGIDATLSWGADVGPGSLFVSLNGNYMLDFKVQGVAGGTLLDYVGTTGTGVKGVNFGSSYEWRLFSTIGYTWKGLNLSLQWQHTPSIEDSGDAAFFNGRAAALNNITGTPAYDLFNLNGSYQINRSVRVRFGVDNLFNRKPALTGVVTNPNASTGQLPGGSYSFFQDTLGRRFSLGANVKF